MYFANNGILIDHDTKVSQLGSFFIATENESSLCQMFCHLIQQDALRAPK